MDAVYGVVLIVLLAGFLLSALVSVLALVARWMSRHDS